MAKTDQPGFFEKHAEKITLVIAGILLAYIMATRVFVSPHRTDTIGPTSEPVQPADMDEALAEEAKRVAGAVERKTDDTPVSENLIRQLQTRISNGIGAGAAPPRWIHLSTGGAELAMLDGPVGGEIVQTLAPMPPLAEIAVWTGPELVIKDLGSRGEQGEPEDIAAAHVTAVLDYGAMTKTWTEQLDGSGIPLEMLFLRVVADRQERLDNGQWGPIATIKGVRPAPERGRENELTAPTYDPANPQLIEAELAEFGAYGVQEGIIGPDYHQVYWPEARNFGTWMHHLPLTSANTVKTSMVRAGHEQPQPILVDKSRSGMPGATRQPRRTARQRPNSGAGMPDSSAMGAMMGDMDLGGGGRGGSSRSTQRRRPTATVEDPAEAKARTSLAAGEKALEKADQLEADRKYDEAKTQYRLAVKRLELAVNVGAQEAAKLLRDARLGLARCEMPRPTPAPTLGNMCKEGKVQVWVHDTDIAGGKTYRYRLRVQILNPLFSVLLTPGADIAHAPELTMDSQSDWSAPILTPTRSEFFLVGEKEASEKVDVIVYHRMMGQIVAEKIQVGPGQTIGAVANKKYLEPGISPPLVEQKEINFDTGYIVVDCVFGKMVAPSAPTKTAEVTLLSPSGALITRTVAADRKSSRYLDLRKESSEILDEIKAVQ